MLVEVIYKFVGVHSDWDFMGDYKLKVYKSYIFCNKFECIKIYYIFVTII